MIYKITDEDYPENPNVTEAECGLHVHLWI